MKKPRPLPITKPSCARTAKPGRDGETSAPRFDHRASRAAFQPPIRNGDLAPDLVLRDDEPEAIGPPGAFVSGCRWLHGEPQSETWRQCGRPRAKPSAYCDYHRLRTIRTRTNVENVAPAQPMKPARQCAAKQPLKPAQERVAEQPLKLAPEGAAEQKETAR